MFGGGMLVKIFCISLLFFSIVAFSKNSKHVSDNKCQKVLEYYPKFAGEFADFLKTKLPTHPRYKEKIQMYLKDIDKWQAEFRVCFEKKPIWENKN